MHFTKGRRWRNSPLAFRLLGFNSATMRDLSPSRVRLRRVLLSLPIATLKMGLIATIIVWAVSWLLAYLPCPAWQSKTLRNTDLARSPRERWLAVTEYRSPGSVRRTWDPQSMNMDPDRVISFAVQDPVQVTYVDISTSAWKTSWGSAGTYWALRYAPEPGCDHATGWPWVAMWYEIKPPITKGSKFSIQGGIDISETGTTQSNGVYRLADVRALPLRIAWSGFIANVAAWGGAISCGLYLAQRSRRLIRHKLGRCVSCGYSLHEHAADICSECGDVVRFRV